jgi:Ca-activated chloride channel family protein
MEFLWPTALPLVILGPAFLGFYVWQQRRRRKYFLTYSNLAAIKALTRSPAAWRRYLPPALYALAFTALALGVARPQWLISIPVKQVTVMLVIDVSRSMEATDIAPNRLAAAKAAAKSLVEELPPDARVGVVSFSDSASVLVPPTTDRELVNQAIDNLRTMSATAIGDGIMAALSVLPGGDAQGGSADGRGRAQPAPRRDSNATSSPVATIVLLSDGANNRGIHPIDAATQAQQRNVRVYTIGVGSREGGILFYGNQFLRVFLDERTLQQIAEITGGQYFFAPTAKDLSAIYQNLGSTIGWEKQRTEVTFAFVAAGLALALAAGFISATWFGQPL